MPGDLNSTSPLSAMRSSTFGIGRPDGVGVDLAVRLHGDVDEGFGLAVELLQVDAERAVEREQVRARSPRPRCRRRGRCDKPEHVLERAVDQERRRARRAAGRRAAPARRSRIVSP